MPQEINHSISVNRPNPFVKAEPEHYRGMFYVRLSGLPTEQNSKIRTSPYRHTIIKILKDDFLLGDCMSYTDYLEWHTTQFTNEPSTSTAPIHLGF
jgi:hypothetical protein